MKTIEIEIKNEQDYQKFLKKVKYYRYFLFSKFSCHTDYKFVKKICEALNIKNRRKRIDFVYDYACFYIDNNNPCNICGFKNNICNAHREKGYKNGCCRKCRYQSNKGCTSSNLACKLFNCTAVKEKYRVLEYKDIDILKVISIKNRMIVKSDYFSLREDVLKDLYTWTYSYAILRMVYRLIKNSILNRFKNK